MNLSQNVPSTGRSSNAIIWIVAAGIAIVVGGIVIASLQPLFFPTVGSAEAEQVDALFRFMLAIGGMIFLLVEGVLVYSILRFRAKPGDMSDGPPIQGNTTLEFVWTIIPAVIVLVLTVYSWSVWTNTHSIKPNEQTVGAVGARFAWTFNYVVDTASLPDGVTLDQLEPAIQDDVRDDGIQLSHPQLHTWVNQPVAVSMTTQDVNHAFWIPGMRVKQDLLAGRTTEVRFTPIEAGTYRIVCAELCGAGHGAMAGQIVNTRDEAGNPVQELQGAWLIVHPDEDTYMREFFEPEARAVLFPPEDPALLGRQILASGRYPCATCHVLEDLGWAGNLGPSLNGIGDRAETRVPGQSAEEYLYESIRLPYDYLVPGYGPLMPQFNDEPTEPNYMPEEDLNAIIAYLLTQRAG
ncbi:MAG: cytochrome c oxidase subunit II [bacterium]|nr:cytochrome c oxidase subunit II [bacterium]